MVALKSLLPLATYVRRKWEDEISERKGKRGGIVMTRKKKSSVIIPVWSSSWERTPACETRESSGVASPPGGAHCHIMSSPPAHSPVSKFAFSAYEAPLGQQLQGPWATSTGSLCLHSYARAKHVTGTPQTFGHIQAWGTDVWFLVRVFIGFNCLLFSNISMSRVIV